MGLKNYIYPILANILANFIANIYCFSNTHIFLPVNILNVSLMYLYISAVKRLIASKIKVFAYIIYVCIVYIYYVYINTHSYSIYL